MYTRNREEVLSVDWGNGTSDRLLVASDGMGFAVAHTVVAPGTSSKLQYSRHLEACYCIAGRGSVVDAAGTEYVVEPGTIYVLDSHDAHELRADEGVELHLVSIFNPPIEGTEYHVLSADGYSRY